MESVWTRTSIDEGKIKSTRDGTGLGTTALIGRPICLFPAAGAEGTGARVAAHLDHNAGWEARPFRAVVACGETWTAQGRALEGVGVRCGSHQPLGASPRNRLSGGMWANLREQPLAHRQLD